MHARNSVGQLQYYTKLLLIAEAIYPMDFYSNQSLGDWTPNHGKELRRHQRKVLNYFILNYYA